MECESPLLFQRFCRDLDLDLSDEAFVQDSRLIHTLDHRRNVFHKTDPSTAVLNSHLPRTREEFLEYSTERSLPYDPYFGKLYRNVTKKPFRFRDYRDLEEKGFTVKTNLIRCRKCRSCLMLASKELGLRMVHELQAHKEACWLTLTYNDKYCDVTKDPTYFISLLDKIKEQKSLLNNSQDPITREQARVTLKALKAEKNKIKRNPNVLDYDQIQDFLKNLRNHVQRKYNKKIRFSVVGEYGTKNGRMHWHMFIYGWQPDDLTTSLKDRSSYENTNGKCKVSPFLSKLWHRGFVNVDVGLSAAAAYYTSNYCLKKIDSKDKKKPIFRHSLGLGRDWLLSNLKKILSGELITFKRPIRNGSSINYETKKVPVPSSYIAFIRRLIDKRKDFEGVSERKKRLREKLFSVASRDTWLAFFVARSKMALERVLNFDWRKVQDSSLFWFKKLYNDPNRRRLEC